MWSCTRCSVATLTYYVNNEIYQQFPKETGFLTDSDERLCLDSRKSKGYTGELGKLKQGDSSITLKIALKTVTITKMRLKVFWYS